MLKKMLSRKIMVTTLALFTAFLIYLMPNKKYSDYTISNQNLEYVYTNAVETIYLLDSNDYLARTEIMGNFQDNGTNVEDVIKDVMEGLMVDGNKEHVIPNGFRSFIPSGTEIKSLELKDKVLTINFSREILDISEKYEDKMIEAIIYTLTSIDGIDKVVIQVEGEVLEKLPHSGKLLPTVLDRSYGINKVYDLVMTNDIDSYVVYYVSEFNDYEYYVPVTKYVNKEKNDKIKVIIDELSTSPIYETNLMSYVNSNVSLIDYSLDNECLKLNFNDAILSDANNDHILEEVVYTISLSMGDNFPVSEVVFLVNNEEIYKNSLKTLE